MILMKSIKQLIATREYKFKKYFLGNIVLIIICLAIGYGIGFIMGVDTAISAAAKIANEFFNIDSALVSSAIHQYNNNIGGCINKAGWKFNESLEV